MASYLIRSEFQREQLLAITAAAIANAHERRANRDVIDPMYQLFRTLDGAQLPLPLGRDEYGAILSRVIAHTKDYTFNFINRL